MNKRKKIVKIKAIVKAHKIKSKKKPKQYMTKQNNNLLNKLQLAIKVDFIFF